MARLNIGLSFQAREVHGDVFSSRPTVFTAWGFDDLQHETHGPASLKDLPWGALVGCEDGSIYIFHPDLAGPKKDRRKSDSHFSNRSASNPNVLDGLQIPSRRPHHLSLSRSRDASPMGSRTNLAVMQAQKSRAVSGLSKAQVEAPKNFVDFEDEQERMKDMISERVTRDSKDRSPRTSVAPFESPRRRYLDDAMSLVSVETTSSHHTPPISPPLSPPAESSSFTTCGKGLVLRIQVTPQAFGIDHAIADIKVMARRGLSLILQSSGQVSLLRLKDGCCVTTITLPSVLPPNLAVPESSRAGEAVRLWSWRSLAISENGEEANVTISALAVPDERLAALEIGDTTEQARVASLELTCPLPHERGDIALRVITDSGVNANAGSLSITTSFAKVEVHHLRRDASIVTSKIDRKFSAATIPIPETVVENLRPGPLSEALAALMSKSEQALQHDQSAEKTTREFSSEEALLGHLPFSTPPVSLKMECDNETKYGVAWSEDELLAFDVVEGKIRLRGAITLSGQLRTVHWANSDLLLLDYGCKMDTHLLPNVKSHSAASSGQEASKTPQSPLITSVSLEGGELISNITSKRTIILSCSARTATISAFNDAEGRAPTRRVLWSKTSTDSSGGQHITALHPLDLDHLYIGTDAAELHVSSLHDLMHWKGAATKSKLRKNPFAILSLFKISDTRTGRRLVVGGGDDGSISVWDARTMKPLARWVLFCEPLTDAIHLISDEAGSLRNCCMCISRDGTIAVIAVDSLTFLFLVPGAPTQLLSMSVSPDNLMLVYADGRARLWDMKTKEFWRSMRQEKTSELLSQGKWERFNVLKAATITSDSFEIRNTLAIDGNPPPALLVDVEMILKDHGNLISSHRNFKALLSILHVPGLDEQADRVASKLFGSGQHSDFVQCRNNDSHGAIQSIFCGVQKTIWWCISPAVTTKRLLAITSLLRTFLARPDNEMQASTLLSFYTVALPLLVGLQYEPPDLATLVQFWDDSLVPEIRTSAKEIFDSELHRLNDDVLFSLIDRWRHRLPFLLPPDERQSEQAALALSLCAKVAVEKYALLTSTTLSDISKSIVLYLNDDTSPHRAIAIDLCSQGFETWQLYIDAKDALRSIFTLATSSSKSSIVTRNPGPAARSAVVHLASNNSPLFMTTLSLDILHPRSVDYSRVIMQMIAFLIRRRPLVLLPNLPRLMEAVVKSLDPGSNSDREAVLDTATEVIALVVQTYPTLDFHGGSQRLAVGTSEGAVIMYDLKTATRLYVLEGHRKRLSGISFSPDGRRMVTLSIEESVVLVWKIGTSFVSFFTPGAPPRQGHAGSDPYKTIPFVVQDQESLTVEAALKEVHFDWQSDRSVRISIRDAVFTFST